MTKQPARLRVDSLTAQLLDAWMQHQAQRPAELDDAGELVRHVERRVDEWQGLDAGYRLIVGTRLASAALAAQLAGEL